VFFLLLRNFDEIHDLLVGCPDAAANPHYFWPHPFSLETQIAD
jgi:hypothetical protein